MSPKKDKKADKAHEKPDKKNKDNKHEHVKEEKHDKDKQKNEKAVKNDKKDKNEKAEKHNIKPEKNDKNEKAEKSKYDIKKEVITVVVKEEKKPDKKDTKQERDHVKPKVLIPIPTHEDAKNSFTAEVKDIDPEYVADFEKEEYKFDKKLRVLTRVLRKGSFSEAIEGGLKVKGMCEELGYYRPEERYLYARFKYRSADCQAEITKMDHRWHRRGLKHMRKIWPWPPDLKLKMYYSNGYYGQGQVKALKKSVDEVIVMNPAEPGAIESFIAAMNKSSGSINSEIDASVPVLDSDFNNEINTKVYENPTNKSKMLINPMPSSVAESTVTFTSVTTTPAPSTTTQTLNPSTTGTVSISALTIRVESIPASTIRAKSIPASTTREESIPASTKKEETIPASTKKIETIPASTKKEETIPASTKRDEIISASKTREETMPASTSNTVSIFPTTSSATTAPSNTANVSDLSYGWLSSKSGIPDTYSNVIDIQILPPKDTPQTDIESRAFSAFSGKEGPSRVHEHHHHHGGAEHHHLSGKELEKKRPKGHHGKRHHDHDEHHGKGHHDHDEHHGKGHHDHDEHHGKGHHDHDEHHRKGHHDHEEHGKGHHGKSRHDIVLERDESEFKTTSHTKRDKHK